MEYQEEKILVGANIKRLRLAAMVTQQSFADGIGVKVTELAAIEQGQGLMPIKIFPLLAATFGMSFEKLIIELGKTAALSTETDKQIVVDIATFTHDRAEIIRLRDAIEEERRTAERQFEFLENRYGIDDIFTREAASRLGRLTCILDS